MRSKIRKGQKGFTLVELLVVMAIMAILIGISVAGLGYALRKSRNIARSASMSNLDKAFASYYADTQEYPAEDDINSIVHADLDEYLEGTWDEGPPGTTYYYQANPDRTIYSVCVNQEESRGEESFVCLGPGVDYGTGWPTREPEDCDDVCGTPWDNSGSGGGGYGGS